MDAPGHTANLERYRARGYRMAGNPIAVITDRAMEVVEVLPPSRGKVDPDGLTVERCPPAPSSFS